MKEIKQFKVFDFFTDTCRTQFFFYTQPNFHWYYMDSILGYSQNFRKSWTTWTDYQYKEMAHWFFSKLIFTKCQLTIIIKIHKLLHIHSFYFTFIANQVAQRQMGELVSQGSQVLISLMTIFFFSKIILKKKNLKIMKMKKKKLKKKKKSRFFLKI